MTLGAAVAIARHEGSAPTSRLSFDRPAGIGEAMQAESVSPAFRMHPLQEIPAGTMHPHGDLTPVQMHAAQDRQPDGMQATPVIQRQETGDRDRVTPGRFQHCDEDQQSMIRRHQTHAVEWVGRTIRSIDGFLSGTTSRADQSRFLQAYYRNFDIARLLTGARLTGDDLRTAIGHIRFLKSNYERILAGLRSIDYACFRLCPEHEYAAHSVFEVRDEYGITLTIPRSYIRLCPLWFHTPDFFIRVSVLIHEVVHRDLMYRTPDIYEWQADYHRMGWSTGSVNPDSYAVFARMIYHFRRDDMGPDSRYSTE